ncbi:MAG: 5-hydroxybenzimidazole synthase [Eubacteriaceae bacterium]|jgi:phosphomethylpyrimidine synthase|nr:5-hydroxybenzimidazole synthase [Eubacteriaceae bacterium]MDK2903983.1 5-hydroxybenzimidazole synthase [Eubacteriaceae bacterium]MDK2961198.1 5-hydroxybenzimidazole synthase [Eubacteriaceae bacterium]MDN5308456.1 5-hydroxybenzimidazole synthase [Eubacteriaceae bacterium]
MTQMLKARSGKITEEMEIVALTEGVSPEFVRAGVAEGRIVIPKNKYRNRSKICGIGGGLDVKVNGLMGTSSDRDDMAMEAKKLGILEEEGANAFMDLSTGDNIDAMRKQSLAISNIAAGCVPVYQACVEAAEKRGLMVNMTSDDLFSVIEKQCAEGIDFMAVHSALNMDVLKILKKTGRVTDVVSRGGSFLTGWMFHNDKENPLYEEFDRLLEILKSTDTVLSIGDAIRPGSNSDSLDQAQMRGLMVAGELTKRALEAGVQVMIEGPGHVPINHIATTMQLQKRLCYNVPYYILGFLATDIAPGFDNITGAIGGAFAGLHGADFLCYLTPAEHLGLPNEEDVRIGVRSTKIAAASVNVLKRGQRAWNRDLTMAQARVNLDTEKQMEMAINKPSFKEALDKKTLIKTKSKILTPADIAAEYFGIA